MTRRAWQILALLAVVFLGAPAFGQSEEPSEAEPEEDAEEEVAEEPQTAEPDAAE